MSYDISSFLCDLLYSAWHARSLHVISNGIISFFLNGIISFFLMAEKYCDGVFNALLF